MNLSKSTIKFALLLAVAPVSFGGCASKSPPEAIPYALQFSAAADINTDAKKRPAPILVKIFELRSASTFNSSNFFSLQDQAEATLGKDLVETEQFVLRPGETKVIRRSGNTQVRSIGIMAEYRLLETSRWRQSIDLPEPKQAGRFSIWQSQPDRMVLHIGVNKGGIELLQQKQ